MLTARDFIEKGRIYGYDFYTGVPCSYLKPFINYTINETALSYVAAANEGDAVAIASGAVLGGRGAVAMCQNSGLGNAVNPLTSLNYIFKIPILLITTLRGEPGKVDEPQHELMGSITGQMLNQMQIPWEYFPTERDQIEAVWERASTYMRTMGRPYGLVMKKASVEPVKLTRGIADQRQLPQLEGIKVSNTSYERVSRQDALRLISGLTSDALVVATTGFMSRKLYALQDSPNHLYMVGSMGCALSLGLGLALVQPRQRVVVIDGDGALLMRMGSMATAGFYAPPNLVHILLDNESHESTGGQETVSTQVDFAKIALACNYARIWSGNDHQMISECLTQAEGPSFLHLKIRKDNEVKLPRPHLTPEQVKNRFLAYLRQISVVPR